MKIKNDGIYEYIDKEDFYGSLVKKRDTSYSAYSHQEVLESYGPTLLVRWYVVDARAFNSELFKELL